MDLPRPTTSTLPRVPDHLAALIADAPRLMTLREVQYLLRLSERQVRRLISNGVLRAQRSVPRSRHARVLISKAEVGRYLAACDAEYPRARSS
jgi:excisionase family DNA binding protein